MTDEFINAFKKIFLLYQYHEKYFSEDRLADFGKNISANETRNAFQQIEFELTGYNERSEKFLEKMR